MRSKHSVETASPDWRLRGYAETLIPLSAGTHAEPKLVDVPGYEIVNELGRGGMGVVYQARHVKSDRIVALKMVLSGEFASPDQMARFSHGSPRKRQ